MEIHKVTHDNVGKNRIPFLREVETYLTGTKKVRSIFLSGRFSQREYLLKCRKSTFRLRPFLPLSLHLLIQTTGNTDLTMQSITPNPARSRPHTVHPKNLSPPTKLLHSNRPTDSMSISQTRFLSDKENSTTPSSQSSSPSKLRISGIGRAPKRNSPHSMKPYSRARTTSVQRAKLHAAKQSKIKHKPTPLNLPALKSGISTMPAVRRRHRQPDRILHIPLQLPKPAIPPVVLDGPLVGVVSLFSYSKARS